MNDHRNAPATILLATRCACCGDDLVDADSIELGIGPVCLKKHGYKKADAAADWEVAGKLLASVELDLTAEPAWGTDAHKIANKLVHRIAAKQAGPEVLVLTGALTALGYTKLARRIGSRLATIEVIEEGEELLVKSPYNPRFVTESHRISGQSWDGARKLRHFPKAAAPALWHAMQASFAAGTVVRGARGLAAL